MNRKARRVLPAGFIGVFLMVNQHVSQRKTIDKADKCAAGRN